MKDTMSAFVFGLIAASALAGCSRDIQANDEPKRIEQQYGVSGAYTDTIPTENGSMKGTLVPVTLPDGRQAQLFIPGTKAKAREADTVYLRDTDGLHPVLMQENATREQITKAPVVVGRRAEAPRKNKRSWEKEALIIGGAAGAGTGIGAIAGGKKGAGIGAAAGGVGGLIYDLMTREKK
ncbi:MAG: hypothetical protein ABI868_11045 [Acidobacteriota bacterium]